MLLWRRLLPPPADRHHPCFGAGQSTSGGSGHGGERLVTHVSCTATPAGQHLGVQLCPGVWMVQLCALCPVLPSRLHNVGKRDCQRQLRRERRRAAPGIARHEHDARRHGAPRAVLAAAWHATPSACSWHDGREPVAEPTAGSTGASQSALATVCIHVRGTGELPPGQAVGHERDRVPERSHGSRPCLLSHNHKPRL